MDKVKIGAELDPKQIESLLQRIREIPIMTTLELEVAELKAGYCELKAPRRRSYDGIFNSFHGGLLMTVADSAAAFALKAIFFYGNDSERLHSKKLPSSHAQRPSVQATGQTGGCRHQVMLG